MRSPVHLPRSLLPAAAAAGLAALLLGCAGPDLGPSSGATGPAWIPDPVIRGAAGLVGETQRYHAQRQFQRPVRFTAHGERGVLERAATDVLRTHGFTLRPRFDGEPLATRRRNAGLGYGLVGARPAVLTRRYVLSLAAAGQDAAQPPVWELTLLAVVERCVAADSSELERSCAPQGELTPELQQELQELGDALRATLAPEAARLPE